MRGQWMSASKATTKGGLRTRGVAASAPPDVAAARRGECRVARPGRRHAGDAATAPGERRTHRHSERAGPERPHGAPRPGGAGVHEGDPVTAYKFLINEDNTGSTAQRTPTGACSALGPRTIPANCNWPSIRELPHTTAPIVAQGTEADLANGLGLPDGKYLISVLADGYKLDGAHFTVPFTTTAPVIVEVQPDPLPDATLRAQVYQDEATTNGAIDNSEHGSCRLPGSHQRHPRRGHDRRLRQPAVHHLRRREGRLHASRPAPWTPTARPVVDKRGRQVLQRRDRDADHPAPRLEPLHRHRAAAGRLRTGSRPPRSRATTTSTAGSTEGSTGYDTEATVAGEPVPTPQFGFVKPKNTLGTGGTGSISGVVVGVKQYTPPKGGDSNFFNGLTGSKTDKPIPNPVLSLADLNNGDQAVWVGRGKRRRQLHHPQRPGRRLHPELVGRAAELHPQPGQRHREERRGGQDGPAPA